MPGNFPGTGFSMRKSHDDLRGLRHEVDEENEPCFVWYYAVASKVIFAVLMATLIKITGDTWRSHNAPALYTLSLGVALVPFVSVAERRRSYKGSSASITFSP